MTGRSLESDFPVAFKALAGPLETGLFSDADGTLSEISPSPESATVAPEIGRLLGRLSQILPVVGVVSGRRAQEASALVGRSELVYLGNHGLERLDHGRLILKEGAPEKIERARVELRERLPQVDGLALEDKGSVLAVHYRRCADQRAIVAVDALTADIGRRYGLQRQKGRQIFELRPPGIDKGSSILELAAEYGLRQLIYLGDDATDIDAFRALRGATERGGAASMTVAVAASESPPGIKDEADYWVESVKGVTDFLRRLISHYEGRAS